MKTFSDFKKDMYGVIIRDSTKKSKYGKFLDKLVFEDDRRGKDESWDLWYFSDNTEFCRDSAENFLEQINKQFNEYQKFHASINEAKPTKNHEFRVDRLRRHFGCFCFYLYSALESFAHETNIFYELNEDRKKKIGILRMEELLQKRTKECSLLDHLKALKSDSGFRLFLDYRNAVMHGYVFPLFLTPEGFFLKGNPKDALFSFQDVHANLLKLCRKSYSKVSDFICTGWRCFEIDELTAHSRNA